MRKSGILFISLFVLTLACWAQQSKPSPSTKTTAVTSPVITTAELRTPAQPDVRPAPLPVLPVGTAIRMKLETPLYTGNTKVGDAFTGRVLEDVTLNGRVMIPVGASMKGRVIGVSQPRRIKGKPVIQLHPEFITMPNGHTYSISAMVADTNKTNGTRVDDEGRIIGSTHSDRDTVELGAGAGVGAIIGGIAGGGKGSLIGAGIGAGGVVAHWFTRRNTAYLPAGTQIVFELSHPMTMTAN